jgi:hypothetical protein
MFDKTSRGLRLISATALGIALAALGMKTGRLSPSVRLKSC